MTATYYLQQGTVPLLISMPHNGEEIPQAIASNMTPRALEVPDTDWYQDRLYDFSGEQGAYILQPIYSRYVIDLNRDPQDINLYPGASSTELCPTTAFDESPLYLAGKQPRAEAIQARIDTYWRPYHQAIATTLTAMKQQFGCAILLEAHSIRSRVPRFFSGQLPDFNFGSGDGISCSKALLEQIQALNYQPYSVVTNGRFKGGYITRQYGQPINNIHAIQLELSQRTYMNETTSTYNRTLASEVKPKLTALVTTLINFALQQGK